MTNNAEKARLITERNAKIAEYNAKLDKARAESLKKYNEVILSKLKSVIEFQAKMLEK